MSRKRTIYSGVVNHCYQRAAKKVVLFYSVSDFLSFFTILCNEAVKENICVLLADERRQLFYYLKGRTDTTDRQIANFLRIKP